MIRWIWRLQMETCSAVLAFCAGNSPDTCEFPSESQVTRRYCVSDLRLSKRLSKQSWGWCFYSPSRSLWRHCNVIAGFLGAAAIQETLPSPFPPIFFSHLSSCHCRFLCKILKRLGSDMDVTNKEICNIRDKYECGRGYNITPARGITKYKYYCHFCCLEDPTDNTAKYTRTAMFCPVRNSPSFA